MQKLQSKFLLLTLGSILLVSCAKEKSYDKEYKDAKETARSEFLETEADGTKTKYLYVPMTLGTPREVARANPFFQGQVKLVNIEFTEAGLAILEVEKDDRFSDNDLNRSPVMLIPGDYKDYRCTEDEYGDCTNTEEENEDVSWDKKKYFLPNFEELTVQEVNELDLQNIDGNDCVKSAKEAKLVDYEISKDGIINIELEKTYKVDRNNWECIKESYRDDNLSANSFKVRFFYSMVKLDKLASPNYEPMIYPIPDHSVYGFFKSEEKKLNGTFDPSRKEINYFVNRWNPNKKVLKYYLSKSYNKKKNKSILDITMKSMHIMNKNLATAGAGFKLEFIQQTSSDNISPGDLRYNSIVLIDDPLANGLLGYAPSVKNPETGEIVQSHINMYGGVLKSGTKFVYEQAIDVMMDKRNLSAQSVLKTDISLSTQALANPKLPLALIAANIEGDKADEESVVINRTAINSATPERNEYRTATNVSKISLDELKKIDKIQMQTSADLKKYFDDIMSGNIQDVDEIEKKMIEDQKRENAYSLDETLSPEFFPIAGTIKTVYPAMLKISDILIEEGPNKGILKPWTELTQIQKEQVADVIMINRYVSTFVHEMGHSLGLRHNFAGSTDADNFYTDVEARALGMSQAPAYSSVMDYAVSEYNELGAFGKYDVAALQYAYTETVGTKNKKTISIKGSAKSLATLAIEHNDPIEKKFLEETKKLGIKLPVDSFNDAVYFVNLALKSPTINDDQKSSLQELKATLDNRIVEYEYCTDSNASLSPMCNRHDEGTTLVEVANQRIERYKKFYKLRNFRDGKNSFTAYDEEEYFKARYKEFSKIRDIFEGFEFYVGIYDAETMQTGCTEEENKKYPACQKIQDRIDSVKIVGDFFLEILKTPDLICAVSNKDQQNIVVSYKKLSDIYDSIKYSINQFVVTSCFDEHVKKKMAEDDLVVVGQNGKFLNGFKDRNPDYKYSTDWSVRGIWADKVIAFRMLFQRVNAFSITDTDHMALIDLPYIKAKVDNYLEHIILGKPLAEPIPFITEEGDTFTLPYVIGNDYKINQVEDSLSWLKKVTNMPKQGDANLSQTVLNQLTRIGTNFSDDIAEQLYLTSNFATVRKQRGVGNQIPGLETLILNDVTYQMGRENNLAYFMISSQKMKPILDVIGQERAMEIYKLRVNPDAPTELDSVSKLFFSIDVGSQRYIITTTLEAAKDPKKTISLARFQSFLGKENGKIIHDLHLSEIKAGATSMISIHNLKMKIMNVPAEGATAEEQLLYGYEVPVLTMLLNDFINNSMTPEVFEFYNLQLTKLPNHFNRYNF